MLKDNTTNLMTGASADGLELAIYKFRFLCQRAAVTAQPGKEIRNRVRLHIVHVPNMHPEDITYYR